MYDQLIIFIKEQIENNDLFKGGLLLMIGGAILAVVRSWPNKVWQFVKRQSMIVIDIPDKDEAFGWINLWLADHNYTKKWSRLLTVKTVNEDRENNRPTIIFSPAPGLHYLWYKRRLMVLSRERQNLGGNSDGSVRDPFREYFTIRLLGRRRDIAFSLINEAYELVNPYVSGKLTVYRAATYGEWVVSSKVPKRLPESVILPVGVFDSLIQDVEQFLGHEQWYIDRGIPYRRGYLFYGPPGNGKTSAVVAIATYFNLNVGIINLGSPGMSDNTFMDLLSNIPKNTIVLFEDVDCIVNGRKVESKDVTFSGFLNALDGLNSSHGQLVFMTTNHKESLDAALVRPGRCDVQEEFNDAVDYQKMQMFERFFPGSNFALSFANRVSDSVSMATLQQHLMTYRNDPQEAFEQAVNIKKET